MRFQQIITVIDRLAEVANVEIESVLLVVATTTRHPLHQWLSRMGWMPAYAVASADRLPVGSLPLSGDCRPDVGRTGDVGNGGGLSPADPSRRRFRRG